MSKIVKEINLADRFDQFVYNKRVFSVASANPEESKIAADFVNTLDDRTRRRLDNRGPGIMTDAPGIPIPNKIAYTSQNSDFHRAFMVDLFNMTVDKGTPEPRLLVASHLTPPYCMEFLPDPSLKEKVSVNQLRRSVIDLFFYALFSLEPHIKIKAKKTSTPGFPWKDINGGDVFASKYGVNFVGAHLTYGYSKKDYSAIKKGHKRSVLEAADFFHSSNYRITKDNVSDVLMSGKFPFIVSGYRTNNLPTPIVSSKIVLRDLPKLNLRSKDRDCSIPIGSTGAMSFVLDNAKLHALQYESTGQSLALSRKRVINIMNFIPSVCRHVYAQSFISGIEKSAYGFLSVNDKVRGRYHRFIKETKDDREYVFFTADRANNDAYLTSNIDDIKALFPTEFSDYASKAFKAVRVTRGQVLSIEGMLSGIPETTLSNSLASLLLFYPRFFNRLLGCDPNHFVSEYSNHILENRSCVSLGDVKIFIPLPTDNLPLVFAVKHGAKNSLIHKIESLGSWLESSKIGFKVSPLQMVEFGCVVDRNTIRIAETSILSKMFFFEGAGFYERDCFKILSRLELLNDDIQNGVRKVFRRHFGSSIDTYKQLGKSFLHIISRANLDLEDFINEHNPLEAQVLDYLKKRFEMGEGVPKDFLTSSSLLDESYYSETLNEVNRLKTNFQNRFKNNQL